MQSIYNLCEHGNESLPIQWAPGTLSPGLKWPEREADHSLLSSAEVKNAWSYTSTHPASSCCEAELCKRHIFTECCVLEHRGKFTHFPFLWRWGWEKQEGGLVSFCNNGLREVYLTVVKKFGITQIRNCHPGKTARGCRIVTDLS